MEPNSLVPASTSVNGTRHNPVGSTVHDLEGLRIGDCLFSMAVGCLRLILGIKDQRDPSIFAGLEWKPKPSGTI